LGRAKGIGCALLLVSPGCASSFASLQRTPNALGWRAGVCDREQPRCRL